MISSTTLIDQLLQDIKTCQHFAQQHWLPATKEALHWKDNQFGWSVDNIMQHLAAFATHYIPTIEEQIKLAQANGLSPKPNFNFTPALVDFFNQLSYEGLEHMTSVGHFSEIDLEVATTYKKTQPDFIEIQEELMTLLEAARTVNIETIQIPSIIQPNATFNLGDCFQFILRHQILHFAQAESIMQAYDKTNFAIA